MGLFGIYQGPLGTSNSNTLFHCVCLCSVLLSKDTLVHQTYEDEGLLPEKDKFVMYIKYELPDSYTYM